jgi:protein SCO1/2
LGAIAAAGMLPARVSRAHAPPFGPVVPAAPAPSLWLRRDDRAEIELRQHLTGKITGVQLMFTACTATCPIQGALFAAVARRLRDPDFQLLSLSIDPTTDTPERLRAWLGRFEAPARWRAAAPRADGLDTVLGFFRGRSAGADRHTAQVYVIDRQARFAFRTSDLPAAAQVADVMAQVARRS